ncbi:Ribosomal RNA large subunit methyltransferase E [Candidatus Xenohaliotis californiensis]|uniref:Ribosomal RNA large subunit methyltransferase E n=1 Tax=Candidatus Xenohaliotis californiensis TaxID=84677 RepID=A0ABM9N7G4_9RICK|nr:Ribosomal RNA large subunit methyltransferase E [Candidatus Xenohaliotis californiensis]
MTKITHNLKHTIKTAKKRSNSSARWLNRQLHDVFTIKAQNEGYRSRSAYKIEGIDNKFNIINKSTLILDIGAAPGGWSQVARKKSKPSTKIWALDILEMEPLNGVNFMQYDITTSHNKIKEKIGRPDLIMSDIAPSFCGIAETDHLRSIDLCESVLELAEEVLCINGSLVLKIFHGRDEPNFFTRVSKMFNSIKRFKPPASRKESGEFYYIALSFKGKH